MTMTMTTIPDENNESGVFDLKIILYFLGFNFKFQHSEQLQRPLIFINNIKISARETKFAHTQREGVVRKRGKYVNVLIMFIILHFTLCKLCTYTDVFMYVGLRC